jgi:hypothetical protein
VRKTRKIVAALLACALLLAGAAWRASAAKAADAAPRTTAEPVPFYLDGSVIVYVTATGACYHAVPDCHGTQTAYALSLAEAVRIGYRPCSLCDPPTPEDQAPSVVFPEGSVIVYITVGGECYHRAAACGSMKSAVPVTLEEAVYLGRRPCARCHPPQ